MSKRLELEIDLREGGPGSGNFGHEGIEGQLGGSSPGGGGAGSGGGVRVVSCANLSKEEMSDASGQIFNDWDDSEKRQRLGGKMAMEAVRNIVDPNDPSSGNLAYDENQKVVGAISYREDDRGGVHVEYLGTSGTTKGAGLRLMYAVAKASGNKTIRLESLPGAVAFYQKLGLTAVGSYQAKDINPMYWKASAKADFIRAYEAKDE